jgi:RNA polymerase sigma-70 factor (ECF subfamily)
VTASAADADDIVQEAFLRLLRTPPPARDEEQWRRFVYKTAGNLIVDRWRRKKRQEGKAAGPSAASVRPPDAGDDVARTFAELSARDRALLWLAYVEGESHDEIAGSLGVGRTSVKVLLFRAKRRLRDLLTAKGLVTRTS